MLIDYLVNVFKRQFEMPFSEECAGIKYIYIGNRGLAHTNVITIAYEVNERYELSFSVAFSNQQDTYNKYIGKELAENRLKEQPTIIQLEDNPGYREIDALITDYILRKTDIPTWANIKLALHLQELQTWVDLNLIKS